MSFIVGRSEIIVKNIFLLDCFQVVSRRRSSGIDKVDLPTSSKSWSFSTSSNPSSAPSVCAWSSNARSLIEDPGAVNLSDWSIRGQAYRFPAVLRLARPSTSVSEGSIYLSLGTETRRLWLAHGIISLTIDSCTIASKGLIYPVARLSLAAAAGLQATRFASASDETSVPLAKAIVPTTNWNCLM
jgi:hypothetical protein